MSANEKTLDALQRIKTSRQYVQMFLEDLDEQGWFWQPSGGVTHIGWQVGHLAVAQYGLALARVRGERPEDEPLIPKAFRAQFGKGSTPKPRGEDQPGLDEIRSVFDGVYSRVLETVSGYDDEQLNQAVDTAHPLFDTKLGALNWCSQHELIHAGQIALLRRLMGKDALR